MHIVALLVMLGGVATTDQLALAGANPRAVQRAAVRGSVVRIRRGWYGLPNADHRIIEAIRVGGSLGCISGSSFHGLWRPPGNEVHISVPRGACKLRSLDGDQRGARRNPPGGRDLVLHWGNPASARLTRGVLPILDCIAQVIRCQPPDLAFAVLESALRARLLTAVQLALLERVVSPSATFIMREAHGLADSGTESIFHFRLLRIGISMQSQVPIPGVGRVDFLIGDRLVVEIDSDAHHGDEKKRLRDLRRDAIAVGLGFIVLRIDYSQVMWDWATVQSTVLALIARGDHIAARSAAS